ncbi:MAG: fimbrial protein pilin [Candidatus Daviesbacteria bacterium GW2011_GWA2_38_24]|uniref:Fimbrial protein pilin n=1 Tax=Candidatus Daviesbacteria bacterium GW2011_GWA2_38_24 TaxID=1618422 RepID=A0A0G0LZD8_9BACT|nr:MAG: fimbrial protein pilin [Candidatus Daviesbacteria bacterium GW2011_GWA2_38_24]KKQ78741.1 MAG: fimbrial protein pilin [Candidatus Daviesbacteria bacterium GW2011_GWA1_38_7]OGE24100.1 MAG: hypothetical protein A2688_04750 [Candidatus Daviesbacteria bacterium RIFCSPHIGHO2_01_FULL_38_8]
MIKLRRNLDGFTLIELLVVVGIIAVLAAVGIAIYSGTLKSSRDSKRRADIQAIAKALEAHYDGVNAQYPVLEDGWVVNPDGSTSVPADPLEGEESCNGKVCAYCFEGSSPCTKDNFSSFKKNAAGSTFKICANLENTNIISSGVYCISSQQ